MAGTVKNPRGVFVEVGRVKTHIIEKGSEDLKPMILVHGIDSSAEHAWGKNIDGLSKARRIIAPDLPGYGLSGSPRTTPNMNYYVDFIGEMDYKLSAGKADIVGHSLGGGIAIGYALSSPDMLRTVTAVSPYGLYRPISIIENVIEKVPSDARAFFGWALRGITSRKHEQFVRRFEAILRAGEMRPAAIAFLKSEINISYADGLPRVTFSTDYFNRLPEIGKAGLRSLFIDGGRDPLFPGFVVKKAAEEVPGAEFYSFRKAGHSPQELYPDRFNRLVLEFVCNLNTFGRCMRAGAYS